MSYSIDSSVADCYPGTTCLVNKKGIKEEALLSEYEAFVTTGKAAVLSKNPIEGKFNFEHYKAIHRFLFEDIYDWAGQIRTTDLAKKNTRFIKASEIEETAGRIFERLNRLNNFKGMPFDIFVENIVDFYCVTNILHPFREGNGRTQRIFITQLVQNAGYEIRFSEIDTDELMIATIQAAGGVKDSLYRIFREAIRIRPAAL